MLINGRHTHYLHVPFLFQIYGRQPSSTSSPRDKRKKTEWTSKKQTSVDDVKNKTSILNRITTVFHHCLFNLNISVETNYVWVWWFVWINTKLSAEVLFRKMRLKYNFTSFTIYCEMTVIKIAKYTSCCLGSTPFYFWKHLHIVRQIEFKNAFPKSRSRERKFEQRLARGLFWSRVTNLITIPDWLQTQILTLKILINKFLK